MNAQTRDFVAYPSLFSPASPEEARLAVINAAIRSFTDASNEGHPPDKPSVAGGITGRSVEQASWLNDAPNRRHHEPRGDPRRDEGRRRLRRDPRRSHQLMFTSGRWCSHRDEHRIAPRSDPGGARSCGTAT